MFKLKQKYEKRAITPRWVIRFTSKLQGISSIKLLHLVSFGQQTWPLLLKIEHMVKLHVFGNNSKTVNNKFGSIWPSSFRVEDFFNISQSETRIALGGHICWRNRTK
jgi:hypothetical protein